MGGVGGGKGGWSGGDRCGTDLGGPEGSKQQESRPSELLRQARGVQRSMLGGQLGQDADFEGVKGTLWKMPLVGGGGQNSETVMHVWIHPFADHSVSSGRMAPGMSLTWFSSLSS